MQSTPPQCVAAKMSDTVGGMRSVRSNIDSLLIGIDSL